LIFTKLIRGIKTLGIVALLLTSIYTTTLIILQLITIKTVKDIYYELKNKISEIDHLIQEWSISFHPL